MQMNVEQKKKSGMVWSLFQIFEASWFASKMLQNIKDRISVVLFSITKFLGVGDVYNRKKLAFRFVLFLLQYHMIWTFYHLSFLDFIMHFFEIHQLLLSLGPGALLFWVLRYTTLLISC